MGSSAKIVAVLVLMLLASPAVLLKGCGSAINGGACGGCPDSTAPQGSTIEAPTLSSAPSATTGACYPALSFRVVGPDGLPLNNVCVELFTNGVIALDNGLPDCGDVVASPQSSIITRTNDSGVVMVEFVTPGGVAVGDTFFVEAVSCATTGISTTPGAI
jgi:hypothetical protein